MKPYEAGEVILNGRVISKCSPATNRLNSAGYIPQDRIRVGCATEANLVDNIIMGTHLKRFKKHKIFLDYERGRLFTASVVKKYSVKAQELDDKAGGLSGGNLQKLIVGREFSQNNNVLQRDRKSVV